MDWKQFFSDMRNAYADSGDMPISQRDYLFLLSIFEKFAQCVKFSSHYDTDFRRNLPGSFMSRHDVLLSECINNARIFAKANPLFRNAGEGIAENVRAILYFASKDDIDKILNQHQTRLQDIFKMITN